MGDAPVYSYTQNATDLTNSVKNINNDYNFVYFNPDMKNTTETNIRTCYAASEYNGSSLNMVPIEQLIGVDSGLHTKDTCKFNAGLLQKQKETVERNNLQNGGISKTTGLNYKIVNGYFADEVTFFLDAVENAHGITNDFTNIVTSTNGKIEKADGDQHQFSVEWTGYFIPTQSGNWELGITSDDSSFMWIGDNAVNDYTIQNAFINNQGIHKMRNVTSKSIFIANNLYPIRIQYGDNSSGNNFILSVKSPNGLMQSTKNNGLFFTLSDSHGSYQKELTYYSLMEQTPELSKQGLFQCYVTDTANKPVSYDQMKRKENQYNYIVIWSALSDTALINKQNYLMVGENNNLAIYDGSDKPIKTLGNTATGVLELADNDGDLLIENTKGEWQNITNNKTASVANDGRVPNVVWSKYKFPNGVSNHRIFPKNVKIKNDERTMLISNNGMYKLEFTPEGNLVIKISINSCSGKANADTYVKKTDNQREKSFYPYRIDNAQFTGEMYLKNTKDPSHKTLMNVPSNDSASVPANSYVEYKEFYPDSKLTPILVSGTTKDCKQICNNDATCKHYYDFASEGKNYCAVNKDSYIPSQFLPKQPDNKISHSSLYIRDRKMNFDKKDVRSAITRTIVTDYKPYSEYELVGTTLSKDKLFSGLDPVLTKQIKLDQQFVSGKTEGFDNHGYVSDFNAYYNTNHPASIPTAIRNVKIKPLNEMGQDYSALLGQINQKYTEINEKIPTYNNIHDVMRDEPRNIYDFKGETLNYKNKNSTVTDALKEDVNTMILKQNEIYILGSITVATLLIAAIYIAK